MKHKVCNRMVRAGVRLVLAAVTLGTAGIAHADDVYADRDGYRYGSNRDAHITPYPPQMTGDSRLGWGSTAIFTIGEEIAGYTPPGIPDGMYAWPRGSQVRLLVNHELTADAGYPYRLKNGAELTGARVSFFDIDRNTRRVTDAGLAFDAIYNRAGDKVRNPSDLEFYGLNRLCSANGVSAWQFGFVDDIFFTGEETDGGTEFALDVRKGDLWAAPAMGRAAWESVAAIEPPSSQHVALIIGDDRGGAPMLLYIGEKQRGKGRSHRGGSDFLQRNGLATGKLYVWVADSGDLDPGTFNGTGSSRAGRFVEIDYYRPDLAGNGEYDELGYATQARQDRLAENAGAFRFSRPEDVSTNPGNSLQVVFASTGRDSLFPEDSWGTTYQINVVYTHRQGQLVPLADIVVLYDGDDAGAGQFAGPDYGLRSPDNLTWADNGMIYVQEDRSVGDFGQVSGEEASLWQLDPQSGELSRIAQMDRFVVAPAGVTDPAPTDIGNWESSGIIDVTGLFPTQPGEVLLLGNVQAHSLRDGVIAEQDLVQGGSLFFLNEWITIED